MAELGIRLVVARIASSDAKVLGEWLRNKLQAMGPVYIKLGQILATNNDIPSDIANELQMLQDKADGIPFSMVKVVLPKEVVHVDEQPIAAASIGIVYKGRWVDTGRNESFDVAIKIMRPDIKRQMCAALWGTSRFFRQFSDRSKVAHHMLDVARQYRRSIYAELDYIREATNMDNLSKGMNAISSWNRCPNIFAASDSMIVMEYLEGNKITDIDYLKKMGLSRRKIADNLLEAFLHQCLTSDIFHSDPHPGNISINAEDMNIGPYLVWYDSGSVVRCTDTWRKDLIQLAISLAKTDVQGVIRSLERMGVTRGNKRARRAVSKFAMMVLNNQDMSSVDTMATITSEIEKNTIWKEDLRKAFVTNSKYVIFGKSIILINQNCTTIDPEFNLLSRSMPIIQRLWPNSGSEVNMMDEFVSVARNISQMPSKMAMLESQVANMNEELVDKQLSGMQKMMMAQSIAYAIFMINLMSHLQ
jgi:ubiquinone biosynthesis protein